MKKCEYPGCKENAEVFGKDSAYCEKHAKEKGLIKKTKRGMVWL